MPLADLFNHKCAYKPLDMDTWEKGPDSDVGSGDESGGESGGEGSAVPPPLVLSGHAASLTPY